MIKKIIIISLLCLALQACIPAAFVVGATAGGTIVYDKRPFKTMIQDRNISNTALTRINNIPQLAQQTHITVATFDRIVLIVGEAPTQELRNQAYQVVSGIPNIKRIYNEITIEPPTSSLAQTNDAWLTTKVKAAMVGEKGLHSGQIKVVTENGVVYLMGIVTHKQAGLGANAARRVEGVQKVVEIFEYD